MELEMTIAGITYKVNVDVEDDYVSGVLGVSVWDGEETFFDISLKEDELEEFYDTYVDQLNEAYIDWKVARAEMAAECKLEDNNGR